MPELKKILIIEDDVSVVDFLKYALERDGFAVNTAMDGLQAVKLVETMSPGLVLLDMMLPGKGGYEIIKSLQTSEHKHIPIIIITGRFTEDSYKNVMLAEPNVREFVAKPIKLQALLSSIHSILRTIPPEQKKVHEKGQKPDEVDPWKINI